MGNHAICLEINCEFSCRTIKTQKMHFRVRDQQSQCKPVRPIKAPEKHGRVENINEDLISKKCDFTVIWVWFQLRRNEY